MKATTLLKNDHTAVKKLLADFGRTTARAAKTRQALMDRIAQELEIHSTIEEEIFYPAVKDVRGGQSLVAEAEAEHKRVDGLVAEAQGMSMDADEVLETARELRDAVVHHATEEEREMFPVAQEGLGAQLEGSATRWRRGKGSWPPPASKRPSGRSRRSCASPLEHVARRARCLSSCAA